MNAYDPAKVEGIDLDNRDVRALAECMTVLPEGGDIYTVVGENGGTYAVDGLEGRCTCPDHQYRSARCKHLRRVAYATGERPIPAWVDRTAIDEHLGTHVDGTPRLAATDGGVIGAESDIESDERPDDCSCWDPDQELPCFECWLADFHTPNPGAPATDE